MGNVETEKNAFEVFAVFVKRLLSVLSIALGAVKSWNSADKVHSTERNYHAIECYYSTYVLKIKFY